MFADEFTQIIAGTTAGEPVAIKPLATAQREAAVFTAVLCVPLLIAGAAAVAAGLLGPAALGLACLVLLAGSLLVWRVLPHSHHRLLAPQPLVESQLHRHYGAANRLTQVRLAMAALLCGLAVETLFGIARPLEGSLAWSVVGFATLAALLDAVDGPWARRQGLASLLGARFDMEVDAFFVLTLSLLCWQWSKAGPWIVLAGAMRYLFILASVRWPWLAAPLPPSKWRNAVCVIQIICLIVSLSPIVAAPWSASIGGLGVLLLASSFARDIRWLTNGQSGRHSKSGSR